LIRDMTGSTRSEKAVWQSAVLRAVKNAVTVSLGPAVGVGDGVGDDAAGDAPPHATAINSIKQKAMRTFGAPAAVGRGFATAES
jgi:hypothetical protein